MNQHSSSAQSRENSFPQRVEEARRHWEARRQPGIAQRDVSSQVPRAFTVALSRELGTQGTSIAKEVGRLLGWQVYDHELLEHIAKEMGLRTALLESLDERQQSWLLELVAGITTAPARGEWSTIVSESAFVHHLIETVLALGVHGECVIVGRGAAFIMPAATTLRVRLVGPERDRVAALGRRLGISEREAALQVEKIDRERTDFVKYHFRKDPTDPRNYDVVLNASRLPVAECAELIVETLHRLQDRGIERSTGRPSS
jgi:cytidylate kinase